MTPNRPSRLVCGLVWGLVILVPLILLAGVAAPWARAIARLDEQIATNEDQLARYRRLVQTLPGLRAELERVRNNDAYKAFYFSAPTPALAGAQLQRQVQDIVNAAKGRLISTQLLPEDGDENPARVRVRTQIQGSTAALLDVLYQIEAARPFLFVERVSVRSSARPVAPPPTRGGRPIRQIPTRPGGALTVRLDLFGFALGGER